MAFGGSALKRVASIAASAASEVTFEACLESINVTMNALMTDVMEKVGVADHECRGEDGEVVDRFRPIHRFRTGHNALPGQHRRRIAQRGPKQSMSTLELVNPDDTTRVPAKELRALVEEEIDGGQRRQRANKRKKQRLVAQLQVIEDDDAGLTKRDTHRREQESNQTSRRAGMRNHAQSRARTSRFIADAAEEGASSEC